MRLLSGGRRASDSADFVVGETVATSRGKPMTPAEAPYFLVSAGVHYESGIPWPDIYGGWDFSPDLLHVVADRHVNGEIRIITVASGA